MLQTTGRPAAEAELATGMKGWRGGGARTHRRSGGSSWRRKGEADADADVESGGGSGGGAAFSSRCVGEVTPDPRRSGVLAPWKTRG